MRALVLCITVIIATYVYAQDYESELQKRIETLKVLLEDYEKFDENLGEATKDASSKFKQSQSKIKETVEDNIGYHEGKMDEFFNKKASELTDYVAAKWKLTDKFALSKKGNLKGYKRLQRINLSQKTWMNRVDKNLFKTKQFGRYLKGLEDILNSIKEAGLDDVKDKAEKLASGQPTAEQIAIKQQKVNVLKEEFFKLAKFAQAVQFHEEEKQRTEGQSGIKQIRTRKVGSENYFSNTHSGGSFCAIHDHSNNIRTVGMGEFVGVLNGIEFRTRHNDFRLYKPVKDDSTYHKTENIEFPGVPQAVLDKDTVDEQITEMREWFKAWVNQDYTVRDYRPFFKPILVYLEGAWTLGAADGKIDEPFSSDRHHIDATSWLDLQDKVRFTSYSGSKSLLENLAHLPTKITRFTENQEPILAQWNYRVLAHPLSQNIPTTYFQPRFDSASQRKSNRDDEQYINSRAARFDIEGINVNGTRESGAMDYNMLDSLMEQIPGKDNYGAYIPGAAFDGSDDELYSANPKKEKERLNLAYYHRVFAQKSKDGKRQRQEQRGFSDRVFVAHTLQDRIAPHTYTNSKGDTVNTKVSFAIPVEMIYLTPLHSWNPYNVPILDKAEGKGTLSNPYSGVSNKVWYLTPTAFFSGDEQDKDPADTSAGEVFMETPTDGKQKVRASGTRIIFPTIDGIDKKVRQRYPIMPIHGEGSALWKKLNALEDALGFSEGATYGTGISYKTGISHSDQTTGHEHIVYVDENDFNQLRNGEVDSIAASTETANGHSHQISIALNPKRNKAGESEIFIKSCDTISANDSGTNVCWDHHSHTLSESQDDRKRR